MFDRSRSVEVIQEEISQRYAELAQLTTADRLTEPEVAEVAIAAQALRTAAEAHAARTAALLDASSAWVADGARSAKDWLAWRTHLPRAAVGGSLRCGRQLRDLPTTEAALLAGGIGTDHVRLLADARRTNPDAFDSGGEAFLIDEARNLLFEDWARAVRYWCDRAAPDDAEERAARRHRDRRAHCSATFGGEVVLDAHLPPVGGAVVARELERLDRQLFEEDLAEARHRLGTEHPPLVELRRTPAQRRADALVLMAERSAAKPEGAVQPRVLLQVLAGTGAVERMCQLSDGTVLTPGEVLPLLGKADVERVVFGSPSKVIDIGHRRRFFDGATRTAIEVRDLTCRHPSCSVPFDRCEVDHVIPWADGGPTTQANGRCLCRYHHRRARDG